MGIDDYMGYGPGPLQEVINVGDGGAVRLPPAKAQAPTLKSTVASERKTIPLMTGCVDYFADALAAVARLSMAGNVQHNPGEPLHWAREKSTDHADTIMRHLAERGTMDSDGHSHTVKAAWRILALLQLEEEARHGLPPRITPRAQLED